MSIRILNIGLVALAFGAPTLAQEPPAGQTGPAPKVEVSKMDWNFGEVWQGEKLSTEIVVKNVGDLPLEIKNVKTSCNCTAPTKPKSPLPPGESSPLGIAYDSKHKTGAVNQTVTLETNDPLQPSLGIRVTGQVKPMYEITPKEGLIFGQMFETSAVEHSVEITNRYTEKMQLRLKEGQDMGPFQVELKELEPGNKYKLTVRTKPPMTVGRWNVFPTILTTWERLPEIPEQIYGFVGDPVRVDEPRLRIGRTSPFGLEKKLKLFYAPDQPIDVVTARGVPDSIQVSVEKPQPNADGKTDAPFIITVKLPPASQLVDTPDVRVEIQTNAKAPEYQKLVVPVELVGPPAGVRPPPAPAPVPGQPPIKPPLPPPNTPPAPLPAGK